jgi:hypothetical protein
MLLLRYYLWIVPHLICGAAALIAFRKNIHKAYPAFLSLLVFSFVFELWIVWAVALVWRSPHLHKWLTVFDVVAVFLLEMLVLHELLGKCRISADSLSRLLRPLPRWAAAFTILFAVLVTASLPQTAQEEVMKVFVTVDLGLNIIAAGLLLTILLAVRILDIALPRVAFGIALGLGITSAVEIGISPLISVFGRRSYITLDLVRMVAFHIAALVWLVYFLLPERSVARFHSGPLVSELQARVQDLQRMVE